MAKYPKGYRKRQKVVNYFQFAAIILLKNSSSQDHAKRVELLIVYFVYKGASHTVPPVARKK